MDGIRNRLLGFNQKKILKPDAVPSVNLPLQDNGEDISSRSERKRKRSILQETKIRLKCLRLKKARVTTAMEPFTTSKTKKKTFADLALKLKKKMHYFWKELDFLIMNLKRQNRRRRKIIEKNKGKEKESAN
ncbi:hypothetical protein AVEN_178515-1 [Araneus ventricosus]|uniref:Uncharacterized protein n=1 Tax=Araneus ventricosus TaxID=182803 RepID=A0A4Y2CFL5_ARAVE|nr:hypothetical protein AVEN_178515-1 [Araneus ventricosus]